MKNMRKIMMSLFIVLILSSILSSPIYAYNIDQALVEKGYPEEYINGLIDEQKNALLQLVNDKDLSFLGMKELLDEYGETDMTLVYSGDLRQESGTTYIDRIFVTADYQWRVVPENLDRDTIAVVLNGSVFRFGTYFASTDYMLDEDILVWVSGKTINKPNHVTEFELVYPVDLKFNGVKQERVNQLRGTAYFELIPTESLTYDSSAEFKTDIVAYYDHIIPAPSVLQTDGALAAGKYLVLVFVALALPFLFCMIDERLRIRIFKR